MRQFSGLDFFSALVDPFPYHSWPSATCGNESTCAEKISDPQIASSGKDTVSKPLTNLYKKILFCGPQDNKYALIKAKSYISMSFLK